jgi:hypothetical protein
LSFDKTAVLVYGGWARQEASRMSHGERPDERAILIGRINALEGLVLMFSGIVLAQAPNDPGHAKAIAILDQVRDSIIRRGEETGCAAESTAAADDLLSSLSESLQLLRRGL